MENMIHNLTDDLLVQPSDSECLREFGLRPESAQEITWLIRTYLEDYILSQPIPPQEVTLVLDDEIPDGADTFAFPLDPENPPDTILIGKENVVERPYGPEQYEPLWESQTKGIRKGVLSLVGEKITPCFAAFKEFSHRALLSGCQLSKIFLYSNN